MNPTNIYGDIHVSYTISMPDDRQKQSVAQKAPFETPNVAVDAVLFTIVEDKLSVLMIQIGSGPFKDQWALPGGLVRNTETLDDAVKRSLFEKTHVQDVYMEQLHAFGAIDRDPRSRTISIAYFAMINSPDKYKLHKADYYQNIAWFALDALPEKLAFDHDKIISYAQKQLQESMMYSTKVAALLPKVFTLAQLQNTYEHILGEELDKRNFRKKMLQHPALTKTDMKSKGGAHRPAQLYRFKKSS